MQERRGLDWATLTYSRMDRSAFQRCFDQIGDVIRTSFPSCGFRQGGQSPHYEHVFTHDVGIRLELTPPETDFSRNKGSLCLSLPGSFFYLQPGSTVGEGFQRLIDVRGLQHFTRLDFQITELNPVMSAEEVAQGVEEGRYWVKGAKKWRTFADRAPGGAMEDGISLYWGSRRSEKLGRTYNKAAEPPKWKSPAIRDEIQLRGTWAKKHGDFLCRELSGCMTQAERLAVMAKNASGALSQHLMYYELGNVPASDKNWIRQAKPAGWYLDRLGKASEPVEKGVREPLDLDRAVESGLRQYGRTFYRYAWVRSQETGVPFEQVALSLFARAQATLKQEDLDWLLPEGDANERKAFWEDVSRLKDEVALGQEHGFWQRDE